jgi:hypothetical protein
MCPCQPPSYSSSRVRPSSIHRHPPCPIVHPGPVHPTPRHPPMWPSIAPTAEPTRLPSFQCPLLLSSLASSPFSLCGWHCCCCCCYETTSYTLPRATVRHGCAARRKGGCGGTPHRPRGQAYCSIHEAPCTPARRTTQRLQESAPPTVCIPSICILPFFTPEFYTFAFYTLPRTRPSGIRTHSTPSSHPLHAGRYSTVPYTPIPSATRSLAAAQPPCPWPWRRSARRAGIGPGCCTLAAGNSDLASVGGWLAGLAGLAAGLAA